MSVVLDLLRNDQASAPPREGARPDKPIQRKPDWIRVKAPGSKGWTRPARSSTSTAWSPSARRRAAPISASAGEEARHLHDHGRHLHAGLRLLQRAHRPAGGLDANEPDKVADSVAKLGLPTGHHLRGPGRSGRRAAPSTSPAPSGRSARAAGHHYRGADADFPAQTRRPRGRGRGPPDVFNHNMETVPGNLLTVRPGARYFHSVRLLQRGEGTRSDHLHQVRHHGGPG